VVLPSNFKIAVNRHLVKGQPVTSIIAPSQSAGRE
jgi:hypothetical protein